MAEPVGPERTRLKRRAGATLPRARHRTHELAALLCRRASAVDYAEPKKQSGYKGSPDDALAVLAHAPHTPQTAAAREANCCPMELSRTICALKNEGLYEEHFAALRAPGAAAAAPAAAPGILPSPNSLKEKIKAGANRLGDRRPIGDSGNTVGEYREAHKLATSAVAAGGGKKAHARAAAAALEQAGVTIGESTFYKAAREAPGWSTTSRSSSSRRRRRARRVALAAHPLRATSLMCDQDRNIIYYYVIGRPCCVLGGHSRSSRGHWHSELMCSPPSC